MSEEFLPDRGASGRSVASPAGNSASRHVTTHPATATVTQSSPRNERAHALSAHDVATGALASSQRDSAPPPATFINANTHNSDPTHAPTYDTPAAEPDQPQPDDSIDATMRSASGELPPPTDAAALERLAARMDGDAAGAETVWLQCSRAALQLNLFRALTC